MESKYFKEEKKLYLSESEYKIQKTRDILPKDMAIYAIEELTFEEKAPRKEALENIISALRFKGMNFLYLIIGDEKGVHFYLGAVKDLNYKKELEMELDDIGNEILKPSINGNFRGSKINELSNKEKFNITNKLKNMRVFGTVEGVPGIDEKSESFQGVDRLVDVMLGDEFVIAIMGSALDKERITEIEEDIFEVYDKMMPLSKESVQKGTNINIGTSENVGTNKSISNGTSKSKSESTGTNTNKSMSNGETKSDTTGTSTSSTLSVTETTGTSKSFSKSKSTNEGTSSNGSSNSRSSGGSEGTSDQKGSNTGKSKGDSDTKGTSTSTSRSESKQFSKSDGENKSISTTEGTNESVNKGTSKGTGKTESKGESTTINLEYSKKFYQDWIKYLDEVILPRIDYGKSKGLFVMTTLLATNNRASLIKLGNTMKSLYSGKSGNKVPLELFEIKDENKISDLKNLQISLARLEKGEYKDKAIRSAISQDISSEYIKLGNVVSTNELSLIAGLPQKEVVGLELKEQVEFGLNFKGLEEKEKIELGNLVQSGRVLDLEISLDKESLNKHTFITGVTGSGKTTTCQRILLSAEVPFMVIEPAKTEYRILTKEFEDLIIFTLGRDSIAPFRINPFEFYPHENISSRVDMIKATLEAAFDMEAAIPQIIESAIYECYESYGWNIATNENENYEEPFKEGVFAFPTLEDLIEQVEKNVQNQGFDDRLKNDYIGSIKARLQGLMVGSKGLMLNCKRSVNFKELVNKRVILELEEIKNASEKSLLMGFILTNLNEAIKACYIENPEFKHITLVEEAHRLLSKYTPGDSLSKKQGVEAFSDMLAEVRKYGESLVIVDQIPDKLTPEVLKNTNTKIVHKIFAEDDKRAIGNTMALAKEQMDFMSNLEVGRAIVFSQGFGKAIQVQVKQVTNTTSRDIISEEVIRENILDFYRKHYKTGVLEGLEYLDEEPTLERVNEHLRFLQKNRLVKEFKKMIKKNKTDFDFKEYIESLNSEIYNLNFLSSYIGKHLYKESNEEIEKLEIRIENVRILIEAFIKEEIDTNINISHRYLRRLKLR
ncbi:MAG: ATP-binding protein [Clostridium sp.]